MLSIRYNNWNYNSVEILLSFTCIEWTIPLITKHATDNFDW